MHHRRASAPRFRCFTPWVLAAVQLSLAGCRSSSGPDWERVVGVVPASASTGAVIEAPEWTYGGDVFTVTVRTVGSSDCTRAAGAEVIYRDQSVEITPYDWSPPAGTICRRDRHAYPRPVEVRLTGHGVQTIRVSGRAETGELQAAIVEIPIQVVGRD